MEKKENQQVAHQTEKMTLNIPTIEALGTLESMDRGPKRNISYRTQEEWYGLKDQPVKCFFLGLKEIPNEKGELVLSGGFASKDGVFLAAQTVIIEAVRDLPEQTPLEITYKGKKKNKSSEGSTNIFEIFILNPKQK